MKRLFQLGMLLGVIILVGCSDQEVAWKMDSIPQNLNPDYQPPAETCPIESAVYPMTNHIDHVIITEVVHDISLIADWWIELYNPTDKPISIAGYRLKTPLFKYHPIIINPNLHIRLDQHNNIMGKLPTLPEHIDDSGNVFSFNINSDTLSLPLAHKYIQPLRKDGDFFIYNEKIPHETTYLNDDLSKEPTSLEIQPHDYLILFRKNNMYSGNDSIDVDFFDVFQYPSMNPKIHFIHESNLTKQRDEFKLYPWQHGMFSTRHQDFAGVGLYDDAGNPIDFVRFGNTSDQVLAAPKTEWTGKNVPLKQPNKLIHSYVRRFPYQDTNKADDWSITVYPTPAAHNLWHNEPDADDDGIPDIAEDGLDEQGNLTACELFNGLPLYQYGARAGFTDIFLEVDLTSLSTKQVLSHKTNFFDNIKNTFIQHAPQYKLRTHIDLGQMYDSNMNPQKYNLVTPDLFAAGGEYVRHHKDPMAETSLRRDASGNYIPLQDLTFIEPNSNQMDVRRFYLFRYGSFGFKSSRGSKGVGSLPVSNSYLPISFNLGGMTEGIGGIGLFQHEFGHTLNLQHSGGQGYSLKSYLSVMNYAYLYGVPLQNEADNFVYAVTHCGMGVDQSVMQKFKEQNITVNLWSTQNPEPSLELMPIFSKGNRADIHMEKINEHKGFRYQQGSVFPIDFNCDGRVTDQVKLAGANLKVEKDLDEYAEILRWANLKKMFINQPTYDPYINIPQKLQVRSSSTDQTLPPVFVVQPESYQCDLDEYFRNKKLSDSEARQ